VQINGKIKSRIDIDPEITDAEFEAVALAEPAVREALTGKTVIKVIARAPKLVNIVIQD
jgi:leucyl-tRNA synthetase